MPDLLLPHQFKTLHELMVARALQSPKRVAYRHFDPNKSAWVDLTWQDLQKRVVSWKRWLMRYPRGSRVALLLNNSPDWAACEQAAMSLGLVVVPIRLSERPQRVDYILRDSQAQVLVAESPRYLRELEVVLGELPESIDLICRDATANEGVRVIRSVSRTAAPMNNLSSSEESPFQVATIVYTSGTTGVPKGVMLSHHNVISILRHVAGQFRLQADDEFFSAQSFAVITERTLVYYLAMLTGRPVVMARIEHPDGLYADLKQRRPTIVVAAPLFFESLLDKAVNGSRLKRLAVSSYKHGGAKRFFSRLVMPLVLGSALRKTCGGRVRFAFSGSAPLSPATVSIYRQCGIPLCLGYGLTEASPLVTLGINPHTNPKSVGQACGVEMRVSSSGEILVRGDNVMMGYWNRSEQVIDSDGWLHTGDIGYCENGLWFITGRKENVLVLADGEKYNLAIMHEIFANDPLLTEVSFVGHESAKITMVAKVDAVLWQKFCERLHVDLDQQNLAFHPKVKKALLTYVNVPMAKHLHGAKIHDVRIIESPQKPTAATSAATESV